MTTPGERPSPEIRALVDAALLESFSDGMAEMTTESKQAHKAKEALLVALGALEEENARLKVIEEREAITFDALKWANDALRAFTGCDDVEDAINAIDGLTLGISERQQPPIDTALSAGGK